MRPRAATLAALAALILSGVCGAIHAAPQEVLVELNVANQAELEQVAGIGPQLSERLLVARRNALFRDWVDLRRRVKGIGPATAQKLSAAGLRIQGHAYED